MIVIERTWNVLVSKDMVASQIGNVEGKLSFVDLEVKVRVNRALRKRTPQLVYSYSCLAEARRLSPFDDKARAAGQRKASIATRRCRTAYAWYLTVQLLTPSPQLEHKPQKKFRKFYGSAVKGEGQLSLHMAATADLMFS